MQFIITCIPLTTDLQVAFAINYIEAQTLVRQRGKDVSPSHFWVGDGDAIHVPHIDFVTNNGYVQCVKEATRGNNILD